ncbi:MAG: hypothetical protein ACUVUD_00005, partial [bacterium]
SLNPSGGVSICLPFCPIPLHTDLDPVLQVIGKAVVLAGFPCSLPAPFLLHLLAFPLPPAFPLFPARFQPSSPRLTPLISHHRRQVSV